jgi:hypothetical protein
LVLDKTCCTIQNIQNIQNIHSMCDIGAGPGRKNVNEVRRAGRLPGGREKLSASDITLTVIRQ